MIAKLFDIQNGKVVPTEHCYTLKSLKDIMDNYPDDHLKIYQYLFYMTCPNPDMNPFFHTPEHEKEEVIMVSFLQKMMMYGQRLSFVKRCTKHQHPEHIKVLQLC